MANIDKEIILVRLRLINKYLNTLEDIRPVNFDEYSNDFRLQLMIERLLQLMTEASSDINIYLLAQLHQINTQTNFDSFIEAGKCGIITGELAAKLAPSTGLRNILVHQYKDIDHRIVFFAISLALEQYNLYLEQVTNYVDSLVVEDD
jgi:uncharacterized protein YutE (UPF0331/DUF86 family)